MQYVEGLSDRAAADAVRSRIDWKYALSLELTDPGFDSTVLCEFRARLISGNAEHLLLDKLLAVCRERQWTQGAWAATDRLDACVDGGACPQPVAVRRRNVAARSQQLGGECARVVAPAQPDGVGGTLCRARRGLPGGSR